MKKRGKKRFTSKFLEKLIVQRQRTLRGSAEKKRHPQ